jgi:dipeptidyl aminopeptidase/acylaminoacyl peptidase
MKNKILLLFAFIAQTVCAQPKTKIVVTDLTRIRQVGGIALSPDGQRAAYTLTTIEPNTEQPGEYDYRTHIYLSGLQPNNSKAITRGTESARQPTWSPDGQSLAFVRTVKGKPQIFVMPLDGGEPYQLTNLKYGASGPVWSPDGRQIAFGTSLTMSELLADSVVNPGKKIPVWSLEKPGFAGNSFVQPNPATKPNPDGSLAEIRAYLNKDVQDKKAKVINRINFQGEATTEPEMSFAHLFVTDVREGAISRALTRGFYSFQGAEWLPDGSAVLTVSALDTTKAAERERDLAIYRLRADGSGQRSLVVGAAGRRYFAPTIAPDGRTLALLTNPTDGINFAQLALATLTNGIADNVQEIAFDRAAGSLKWATVPGATTDKKAVPAAYALYFTAPANGGFPLYRLDTKTRQVSQLTDFTMGVSDFDVSGNRVVFAKIEVANPSELYRADVPTNSATAQNQTRLTNHNDWIAQKNLSYPEKRTYKNTLGQTVDYWIMKPTGLETGLGVAPKKHPLVLNMHGGPTAMWGPGEGSLWHEFQYLCAQGYGVVYANPRGSGGYGLKFQQANYRDWGTGPAEDVLAAATDAARENWVDTSRQVITGGSYAGYLTAWIVGHDQRFKAAFAQRGVYELTTFMGEANAWDLVPDYFGYPWTADGKASLDANSPYTFAQNIRTPLLIKHGENDLRTGVSQSEMLYKTLKLLNRPVEYVRMPGATHELSRTGNVRQRIDRMLRIYEFFERFVGGSERARE